MIRSNQDAKTLLDKVAAGADRSTTIGEDAALPDLVSNMEHGIQPGCLYAWHSILCRTALDLGSTMIDLAGEYNSVMQSQGTNPGSRGASQLVMLIACMMALVGVLYRPLCYNGMRQLHNVLQEHYVFK